MLGIPQASLQQTARNTASKTVLMRSHHKVPPLLLSKDKALAGDEYRMYTGGTLEVPSIDTARRKKPAVGKGPSQLSIPNGGWAQGPPSTSHIID